MKKVGEKWLNLSRTSDYIPGKNFNPILSNPNFSFPVYHVSFNLITRDIDIISRDISIFDDTNCDVKRYFELEMTCFVTCFLYAVTPLSVLAVNIISNATDMKVGNHIAM